MIELDVKKTIECDHKQCEKIFVGVQEDIYGMPKLTMWNCKRCGSTIAEPVPFMEKIWKAIQDLTERIQRLEASDKFNAMTLSSLSQKEG